MAIFSLNVRGVFRSRSRGMEPLLGREGGSRVGIKECLVFLLQDLCCSMGASRM